MADNQDYVTEPIKKKKKVVKTGDPIEDARNEMKGGRYRGPARNRKKWKGINGDEGHMMFRWIEIDN